MNWHLAPELPTEPGLYVVTALYQGARPQLVGWSRDSTDWRLGARKERVDAFLGPLPALPSAAPNPHAAVEDLFAPAASQRSNRR